MLRSHARMSLLLAGSQCIEPQSSQASEKGKAKLTIKGIARKLPLQLLPIYHPCAHTQLLPLILVGFAALSSRTTTQRERRGKQGGRGSSGLPSPQRHAAIVAAVAALFAAETRPRASRCCSGLWFKPRSSHPARIPFHSVQICSNVLVVAADLGQHFHEEGKGNDKEEKDTRELTRSEVRKSLARAVAAAINNQPDSQAGSTTRTHHHCSHSSPRLPRQGAEQSAPSSAQSGSMKEGPSPSCRGCWDRSPLPAAAPPSTCSTSHLTPATTSDQDGL